MAQLLALAGESARRSRCSSTPQGGHVEAGHDPRPGCAPMRPPGAHGRHGVGGEHRGADLRRGAARGPLLLPNTAFCCTSRRAAPAAPRATSRSRPARDPQMRDRLNRVFGSRPGSRRADRGGHPAQLSGSPPKKLGAYGLVGRVTSIKRSWARAGSADRGARSAHQAFHHRHPTRRSIATRALPRGLVTPRFHPRAIRRPSQGDRASGSRRHRPPSVRSTASRTRSKMSSTMSRCSSRKLAPASVIS